MSWEKRVVEELDELRKRWKEARRRLLSEAAGKAVDAEEFVEIIDMLFIEAESELEAFEQASACGDAVNADPAAIAARAVLKASSSISTPLLVNVAGYISRTARAIAFSER